MLVPGTTAVALSVLVTDRSATGVTVSVSVRELLLRSESVVPLGTVAVKVLATLPLVAVTLAVTVKLRLPPLGSVGTTTVPASKLAMLSWPAPGPAVGHTAPPAALHTPRAVFVKPAAAGSLRVLLLAALGPLLVRVTV